ncbi:MAG TPA: glycosyltransferase family 2 protein [Burkholderiales bacterium]|nr:glycosyltransferase family 2 protein [Burkholderiales bacterium]
MFAEVAFWICLGSVIYIYAGYPVCVFIITIIWRRKVHKAQIAPGIAVVISAFNEEREIAHTIENKLAQDYPADRLEIIVISDGSTDRTDEIVQGLAARNPGRVTLHRQEPRQGKTQALNLAMSRVSADIVVFSDANSIYAPSAISMLARNFADPSVGYVTGNMVYTNPADSAIGEGSGSYMSYENVLRSLETRLGSVVGVDGGVDAIRRENYVPMRADQLPDFVLPLSVVEQGKRVVYEPDARVYEAALSNATEEFRMRVRVSLRALWALHDKRGLLNPFRYPMFSWQLLSHKVLRYLAFLPIAGLIVFNVLALGQHPFYAWFMGLQIAGYGLAMLGHVLRKSGAGASRLLAPYYFVVLNAACLLAFWKFVNGQKMVLWTPRKGA